MSSARRSVTTITSSSSKSATLFHWEHIIPPIPQPANSSVQQTQTRSFRSARFHITNRLLIGFAKHKRSNNSSELKRLDKASPPKEDMMGPSLNGQRVHAQSAEYMTRFAHRPSTRPKVIGLDSETMIPREKGSKGSSRGIGGFFPPVKLRMSAECSGIQPSSRTSAKSPSMLLELAPEHPSGSPDHWSTRTAPASITTTKQSAIPTKVYPHLHESKHSNVKDLSDLPRPQLVVSRDTPWVYRYKVKKNMNELSKIMASKTPATTEYIIH